MVGIEQLTRWIELAISGIPWFALGTILFVGSVVSVGLLALAGYLLFTFAKGFLAEWKRG